MCDFGDLTSLDISFSLCKNIFKCLPYLFIPQTFMKLLSVNHLGVECLNPSSLEKGAEGVLPWCPAGSELEKGVSWMNQQG